MYGFGSKLLMTLKNRPCRLNSLQLIDTKYNLDMLHCLTTVFRHHYSFDQVTFQGKCFYVHNEENKKIQKGQSRPAVQTIHELLNNHVKKLTFDCKDNNKEMQNIFQDILIMFKGEQLILKQGSYMGQSHSTILKNNASLKVLEIGECVMTSS